MKCLLVSDIHYALKQFDWTTAVAADFDVVIIAGDHIDISGHVDGPTQVMIILKYLRRLHDRTRLIVSSGNHDLDSRNAAGEKVARWMRKVRDLGVPTDGDSLEVGDTLFTICPWWDGPSTRDEVGEQLARDARREKQKWIWVYHAPPDASPISWTGHRHYGDEDLVRWIHEYGPDIVLTGHIHQSPFCKGGSWVDQIGATWVFNAGRQPGPLPTHIIFDTDRNMALWFSLAGAEITKLDQPLCRPIEELKALPDWLIPTSTRHDPL
ncbi:MAG: metallophosphoesterase family protein [Hyphomicrobiales bacterium]|nr:metallophosphoesterase family protein [Hyphomicrobiales bacterium]